MYLLCGRFLQNKECLPSLQAQLCEPSPCFDRPMPQLRSQLILQLKPVMLVKKQML
jgi:hypothetical protein